MTEVFLAEAERFGQCDSKAAEAHYREALALFRIDQDQWNIAWVLYHLADMFSEDGNYAATQALCEESLALGRDGCDHEVVALNHRVLGDAALAMGDASGALRSYWHALEHAYRFQVEPRDPDDYTLWFYADMAHTLLRRLLTLSASEPKLAQVIASRLRRVWINCGVELASPAHEDTLLAAPDLETQVMLLFPAPLAAERSGANSMPPATPKLSASICRN